MLPTAMTTAPPVELGGDLERGTQEKEGWRK